MGHGFDLQEPTCFLDMYTIHTVKDRFAKDLCILRRASERQTVLTNQTSYRNTRTSPLSPQFSFFVAVQKNRKKLKFESMYVCDLYGLWLPNAKPIWDIGGRSEFTLRFNYTVDDV